VSRARRDPLPRAARDAARTAVREIARALRAVDLDAFHFASGAAGLAVALAHADRTSPASRRAASRALDHAIEAIAADETGPSLFGGFTGVAWAAHHVAPMLGERGDPNEEIDDALARMLACDAPWDGPFDLVDGLVGIGVYALDRLPRTDATRCLEHVVRHLDALAETDRDGFSWSTRIETVPEAMRAEHVPHRNLGLAHGVPGVITLLAAAQTLGLAPRGGALLDRAVDWLLAQRLPPGSPSCFAAMVGPDVVPHPARSAWCYGDPGVAVALLLAAHCVGRERWHTAALEIALCAARRPMAEAGVVDASLCHGAGGLVRIFHRLHELSGNPELADATRRWVVRTLELRVPGEGVAGYRAYDRYRRRIEAELEAGVLSGAGGVALALASALTNDDAGWDRPLLLSLPSTVRPRVALEERGLRGARAR
jgi:hypothetical protein